MIVNVKCSACGCSANARNYPQDQLRRIVERDSAMPALHNAQSHESPICPCHILTGSNERPKFHVAIRKGGTP